MIAYAFSVQPFKFLGLNSSLAYAKLAVHVQWVPQLFDRLEFLHVNKSCKIECCRYKMHQIIQDMILSRGLELKPNRF